MCLTFGRRVVSPRDTNGKERRGVRLARSDLENCMEWDGMGKMSTDWDRGQKLSVLLGSRSRSGSEMDNL